MNLSKLASDIVVKIVDSRNPDETLTHILRPFQTEDRILYNRIMSENSDITASQSGKEIKVGGNVYEGAFIASAKVYDSMIKRVEGYTITTGDGEVDLMTLSDPDVWRMHVPTEHKMSVVQELLPRTEVVKNSVRKSEDTSPVRVSVA